MSTVLLFALTVFLAFPVSAQTADAAVTNQASPPAKYRPSRYLFIVETSQEMKLRSTAVHKTINSLLLAGLNTQLHAGDSIGLWTYNERLFAGDFPLQEWSPEKEQSIASNIVAFVKGRRFEKQGRLEAFAPALKDLVAESEKLTVILISDGLGQIIGTPYNRHINEFFRLNAFTQKQQRMPFVIVLRSFRGQYCGITFNLAPWPVTFPDFPPEPKTAPAPKVAAAAKPKPAEKTAAAPLIVVGKKPEPVPVAPEAAPVSPEAAVSAAETNATPGQTAATPAQAIAPVPATVPSVVPVISNPPATAIEPKPAIAKPETQTLAAIAAETNGTASLAGPPTSSPSTQVASATEVRTNIKLKLLLIIGALILVMLVVIVLLLLRRKATQPSLITRSMDQEKK